MLNCTFQDNSVVQYTGQVSGYGGAIYVEANHVVLEIRNCSFDGNVAEVSGGTVFLQTVTGPADSSVVISSTSVKILRIKTKRD